MKQLLQGYTPRKS